MISVVESFRPSWAHSRDLTRDFIEGVPFDRWDWSPHFRYAPLNKQFRHMICVEGVYVDGLVNRVTDFGIKHSHYKGSLDRDSLLNGLSSVDEKLEHALGAIVEQGDEEYTIEFYGQQTLGSYLNTFLYHEALHQGQWSFYASLGNFETPSSWKLNWGL